MVFRRCGLKLSHSVFQRFLRDDELPRSWSPKQPMHSLDQIGDYHNRRIWLCLWLRRDWVF